MVEKYNTAARMQGLSEQQMQAIQGDLSVPLEKTPETMRRSDLYRFDVAVISMALHHVENPQEMVARLVERLRDGGSLLIIDWATEPNQEPDIVHHQHSHHAHHHADGGENQQQMQGVRQTMSSSSFGKDEMIAILKNAGCSEADFVLHPEVSKLPAKFGGEKRLFFARGKKH
jgi:SAM-dependent methyltransferase